MRRAAGFRANRCVLCTRASLSGTGGIPRFSAESETDGTTERTFSSFGYEWNSFDAIREEDESFAAIYFKDLDLPGLAGRIGLDAGCGKGRFTRVLARHLQTVVALDGSEAVHAAVHNLRDQENVGVVRADLRLPLFAPQSFDFISSLGVLHHLDDPREGFEHLAQYLARGGQMLVYLYSRPDSLNARWSCSVRRLRHAACHRQSAPSAPQGFERPGGRLPLRRGSPPGTVG